MPPIKNFDCLCNTSEIQAITISHSANEQSKPPWTTKFNKIFSYTRAILYLSSPSKTESGREEGECLKLSSKLITENTRKVSKKHPFLRNATWRPFPN
ncbi:hypothetical protein NPIL_609511 [Nephila pilipes]|uniref:Uncharacterized protein n=1 Tax=Nephila pilipes TaxID=299642 RepID=A0A8X6PXA4_NEPPI|nr:hypothetical protein NPIL_609511 [Nephila pilipes]